MHETQCIDDMQSDTSDGADVSRRDQVVIARIGVGDATAARRNLVQPTLIKRFKKNQDGARARYLLRIDQLLAASELPGGYVVLHLCNHHGDDAPRLGNTSHLSSHPGLDDLRLNLPETCLQRTPTGTLGYQYPRRAHKWIDDVAHPQGKLLELSAHTGTDHGFVQVHLGLSQLGLGAGFLGGKQGRKTRLGLVLLLWFSVKRAQ